jgi:hypothetical protein
MLACVCGISGFKNSPRLNADFYQLSLQVSVTLLAKLRYEHEVFSEDKLRVFLRECLGPRSSKELNWICDSLASNLKLHLEVESRRRFLRVPLILAEPTFIAELRRGPALRALRRIFLLNRVHRIVEDCLDDILTGK